MSRVRARHGAIVVAVLLVVAVVALWLHESSPETVRPAATPVAAGKAVRVAPSVPRRVRANDAAVPAKSDAPAGPPAALVVRVVSGTDRRALAGAAVYVIDAKSDDWRAESDASGTARFEDLPAGRTEIRAEMGERIAANRTLALAAGAKETVEVPLDVAVVLEGSVVDGQTSGALSGAEVELVETVGSEQRSIDRTTSDSAGRFRFAKVPASTVLLVRAALHGHGKAQQQTVTPSPGGGTGRVELRMWRTGVLRGFVRGPDGSAVYDGWVHVARGLLGSGWDALTADDGAYVVHDVPLGSPVVVTAGAPEWADAEPVSDVVVDRATGEASLDLVLRRPATLVVRVFDPSGQPVDAALQLDGSVIQGGRWSKEHLFVRERVTPGTHVLRAEMQGFPPVERDVVLPEGGRIEIELRLEAGVSIAGMVVDEAGNPVAGAQVWISDPDSSRMADAVSVASSAGRSRTGAGPRMRSAASSTTPADGTFRIESLPPGPRAIFVMVEGLVAAQPNAGPDGAASKQRIVEAPAQDVRLVVAKTTRVRLSVLPRDVGRRSPQVFVHQGAVGATANFVSAADAESSVAYDVATWSSESVLRCAVTPCPSTLRLSVPGFAPVVLPMNAAAGTTTDLGEVQLESGLTISGRVVDAEGHPIAGATTVGPMGRDPVVSGEDGAFTLPHLAAGPAVIRALAPSRSGAAFVPAAESAGAVTITLRLVGVLKGAVVDASGAPMKGATVTIRHGIVPGTADPGRRASATTRDDGSFEWPVAAGACRVSAGGAWVDVDVPEDGEARVRLIAR